MCGKSVRCHWRHVARLLRGSVTGYDLNYILAQALRWHATSVNLKSSPIPPEWKAQFDEFEKRMGYRFILRRLQYPTAVVPGSMMPVHIGGTTPEWRRYTGNMSWPWS